MAKAKKEEAKPRSFASFGLVPLRKMADFARIPIGVAPFDCLTGGGIPEGTNIIVHGPSGAGKTTLLWLAIAAYQRKYPDKFAVYINSEFKLDSEWAAIHGVDLDRLLVANPETGEIGYDLIKQMAVELPTVGFIGLDSIEAMTPQDEAGANQTEKSFVAIGAKVNNQFYRQWSSKQKLLYSQGRKITLFAINQERSKAGVFYGDPTVIPGGNGQIFYSYMRIALSKNSTQMEEVSSKTKAIGKTETDIPLCTTIRFTQLKPFKIASEFDMWVSHYDDWQKGEVDDIPFLWLWGQKLGLIKPAGRNGSLLPTQTEPLVQLEQIRLLHEDRGWRARFRALVTEAFIQWRKGELPIKEEAEPIETEGEPSEETVAEE